MNIKGLFIGMVLLGALTGVSDTQAAAARVAPEESRGLGQMGWQELRQFIRDKNLEMAYNQAVSVLPFTTQLKIFDQAFEGLQEARQIVDLLREQAEQEAEYEASEQQRLKKFYALIDRDEAEAEQAAREQAEQEAREQAGQLRHLEQDLAFARQLLKEESDEELSKKLDEENPLLVSEERAKELKKEQADDDGNAQDALTYEEFDDAPTNQLMELNGRLYFRKTIMDYFIKTALLQNKFIDPFTQEPIDPKILHALIDHFNLPQNILDVDLTNPVYKYLKDIQDYKFSGVQSSDLDTEDQANKKGLIDFFKKRN